MRDDRHKWSPALGHARPALTAENIEVGVVTLKRQTVISGALNDCLAACGIDAATAGGTEMAVGDAYALRQRRDRLLVVNAPGLSDGWHVDRNIAVSDFSAAYAVISLAGSNAERLIATGTEFVGDAPSPSVSRLWHGFGTLLYRHNQPQSYRMHVRAAHVEAVWEMIRRQVSALDSASDLVLARGDLANATSQRELFQRKAS
ncbi:hypothetical protein [uncultured Ruegeria sp.]|uniref:hypothetical protein n=1 Tax=uncultured Ruegeria sp. TaxID=259304 RepID=UPI0026055751|nr:hypothetical protein [uncultured Ruegeria sp.]